MRNFNQKEIKPLIPNATTRDTGIAVWYWKSVQTLLKGTSYKKELTPEKLLLYMDLKKMDLEDLLEQIDDLDEIDNLANDVKSFLAQ